MRVGNRYDDRKLPALSFRHVPRHEAAHQVDLRRVNASDEAVAGFAQTLIPEQADARDSDTWKRVFDLLGRGQKLAFEQQGEQGLFQLAVGDEAPEDVASEDEPEDAAEDRLVLEGTPRIGLYAPWTGSMDEGWARYVFDSFGVPFVSVRNEMIRAGNLDELLS